MGKVLIGMSLTMWFGAGNMFMFALANDGVAFTSWDAIGIINVWIIGLAIIALATRCICADD